MEIKSVCLRADISPSASYLEKHPLLVLKSSQGCLLLVWPFLRQGTLTPTTLRGPAPNGHPCPDGALAASMRLGPLRVVCVQPAPKSRFAVSGLPRRRSTATATAKASRLKLVLHSAPVPLATRSAFVGPTLAGKGPVQSPSIRGVPTNAFPAKAGPTESTRCSVGSAAAGKLLICF
jgi:hypothetical protein